METASCFGLKKGLKGVTKVRVSVYLFEDGGAWVAYSPEFDFSACGRSRVEARESFSEALEILLDDLSARGALLSDLEDHGWEVSGDGRLAPPSWERLSGNEAFREILDGRMFQAYCKEVRVSR